MGRYPAKSRTFCGRIMGETESEDGSAAVQQDHVLPVDGAMGEAESAGASADVQQDHVPAMRG
jgi:hypothetical protein